MKDLENEKLMKESEVKTCVKKYLEEKSWKQTYYKKYGFYGDLSFIKENVQYVIEVKGDTGKNRSFRIKYAIGEIVALMYEEEKTVRYALALPMDIAVNLHKFGLKGMRLLNIHLFAVLDSGLLRGTVYHLTPEKVIQFINELREGESYIATLSTPP